ncbi:hypothetical protein CR513_05410, partial [Mucuna pruriens]
MGQSFHHNPSDGSQDPRVHLQAFQMQVYISGGDNLLSCKLFPGMLREVAMRWFSGPPLCSIRSFSNLVFQKGLRLGPFSDCLALSKPTSMSEIRAQTKKHVEAEEDKEDRLQAERGIPTMGKKLVLRTLSRQQYNLGSSCQEKARVEKYTPLKVTKAQILREVYHLQLLDIPPPMERLLSPS